MSERSSGDFPGSDSRNKEVGKFNKMGIAREKPSVFNESNTIPRQYLNHKDREVHGDTEW